MRWGGGNQTTGLPSEKTKNIKFIHFFENKHIFKKNITILSAFEIFNV